MCEGSTRVLDVVQESRKGSHNETGNELIAFDASGANCNFTHTYLIDRQDQLSRLRERKFADFNQLGILCRFQNYFSLCHASVKNGQKRVSSKKFQRFPLI